MTDCGRRLEGWDEIAFYINKTKRTAQNWHRERHMPIHSEVGGRRYAWSGEIDAWLRTQEAQQERGEECVFSRRRILSVLILVILPLVAVCGYFLLGWLTPEKVFSAVSVGNELVARNETGQELWREPFPDYTINDALLVEQYFNPMGREIRQTHILVLLKHDLNRSFAPEISIRSTELDGRFVVLNNSGDRILDAPFSAYLAMDYFGFSKVGRSTLLEVEKNDEAQTRALYFQVGHSRGMYPSSMVCLRDGERYSFNNPGHILLHRLLEETADSFTLSVFGKNNIMAHLDFYAVIPFKSEDSKMRVYGIPNLHPSFSSNIDNFLVFLPRDSEVVSDEWLTQRKITILSGHENCTLTVRKDHTIVKFSVDGTKVFQDDPAVLAEIYHLVNAMYQAKLLDHDLRKAYDLILEASSLPLENPYLKSALLYFQGDLEVDLGLLTHGEETLHQSLTLYPDNPDSFQRLCEIEFLRGRPMVALETALRNINLGHSFWGMLNAGLLLFEKYCHLQTGAFDEISRASSRVKFGPELNPLVAGLTNIFTGNYETALDELWAFERTFFNFEVEEIRLHLARAMLLSGKDDERAKFYFSDIARHSVFRSHLAEVSFCYYLAGEARNSNVGKTAKASFDRLLDKSAGDLETRLWLFYDAYVYGRIMEMAGNEAESLRGYRTCIDANPHTDLARQSEEAVDRLAAGSINH